MLRTALITAAASLFSTAAFAASPLPTPVCHVNADGKHVIKILTGSQVSNHLGHGDWRVKAEVCGDGRDNDCDNKVDEGCAVACPCDDIENIASECSAYPDDTFSLIDFYSETTGELFGLNVSDGSFSRQFLVNAYTGSSGAMERVCSVDGAFEFVSEAEYDACYDKIEAQAQEVGLIAE